MAVAALTQKGRLAPIYLAFVAAVGQIIGCVFLSRGPPGQPDWKPLYGLEVLTGTCIGMGIGVVTLMTPYVTEKRDHGKPSCATVLILILTRDSGCNSLNCAVPFPWGRNGPRYSGCRREHLSTQQSAECVSCFGCRRTLPNARNHSPFFVRRTNYSARNVREEFQFANANTSWTSWSTVCFLFSSLEDSTDIVEVETCRVVGIFDREGLST